jgi:hypothetical protein
MNSMHKIMDLRNKVHANLHQKNSLALYRRNAAPRRRKKTPEDQVKPPEDQVKPPTLLAGLSSDLSSCADLLNEMSAVFVRWKTQAVYRTIGLNPISGFGLGKAFDGDLNKASALRTVLTNVGGQAIGNTVNGAIALSTFKDEDFDTATKAHLDCVDVVLNNPKYNALKADVQFAEFVSAINEGYLGEPVAEDDNIIDAYSRLESHYALHRQLGNDQESLMHEGLVHAYKSYIKSIMVASGALTLAKFSNAYHGYKRNGDSIGYGVLWFMFGGLTAFGQSIAQGYAKNIN